LLNPIGVYAVRAVNMNAAATQLIREGRKGVCSPDTTHRYTVSAMHPRNIGAHIANVNGAGANAVGKALYIS
jgi:hypothetical protein